MSVPPDHCQTALFIPHCLAADGERERKWSQTKIKLNLQKPARQNAVCQRRRVKQLQTLFFVQFELQVIFYLCAILAITQYASPSPHPFPPPPPSHLPFIFCYRGGPCVLESHCLCLLASPSHLLSRRCLPQR